MMVTINLIPQARLQRRARQRCATAWAIGLSVYATAVAVGALAIHGPVDEGVVRMRTQAKLALASAEEAQAQRTEMMRSVAAKSRLLEASRTVGVHPDWSVLIRTIASLRGGEVVLAGIEISEADRPKPPAGKPGASSAVRGADKGGRTQVQEGRDLSSAYVLRLTGLGATHSEVMAFVRRLEAELPVREITVVDARTLPVGVGELTTFELRGKLMEIEVPRP